VAGVDLVPALARRAAARGWGVFLLGGGPGVAELAARRLKQLAPGLHVVGCFAGDASPAGDDETRAAVATARPQLLLVAYGAPKQELWIHRNAHDLGVPVSIGVGGAFDFLAGRVPRAPAWMRRLGIEWLFRLMRQPWRARRMAVLPVFALLVLRQRD
jgi:N-acetylglucosaminyldiphosphoundecaprenol N-acetyl-beta-D-mannosaminyltransferase